MATSTRSMLTAFAACGLTGAAVAGTDGDAVQRLEAEVAALRAEVQQLRGEDNEAWLTEARAEEIRSLVHDVLADADTRASLLQAGAYAGWDDHFYLGSPDGNWYLQLSGQVQFRFVSNFQDMSPDDDDRWGFEARRTKLKFQGHVVDPTWNYVMSGAFGRDGGEFVLEDAFVEKDFENGWLLRWGQFKAPFMREALVSSSRQLTVERSLVNGAFNQGREQGVELAYAADGWRLFGMVGDGFNTDNTPALDYDSELSITGRAEILLAGEWSNFKDFTNFPSANGEPAYMLGLAGHWEKGEFGTAMTNEVERTAFTADLSAEWDGANAFAAFIWNSLDDDNGLDADQWGLVLQGGVFLNEDWELFGRYEFGDADLDDVEDLNAITVGVNRYWDRHTLKWTTDVIYGIDEIDPFWSSSGAGVRSDATGEDGQIVLRSQFQLLF